MAVYDPDFRITLPETNKSHLKIRFRHFLAPRLGSTWLNHWTTHGQNTDLVGANGTAQLFAQTTGSEQTQQKWWNIVEQWATWLFAWRGLYLPLSLGIILSHRKGSINQPIQLQVMAIKQMAAGFITHEPYDHDRRKHRVEVDKTNSSRKTRNPIILY